MSDAMAAIYRELTEIFRDVFEDPSIILEPRSTASDINGWDSLKQVEILIAAQRHWGFKFTSREIDALNCVGDMADTILRRLAL